MNAKFKKILSGATVVATLGATMLMTSPVFAAGLTSMSDTMSCDPAQVPCTPQKISVAANHEIFFVTSTGITYSKTLSLTFLSDFTLGSLAFGDVDIAEGSTGVCSSATFTEETVAAAATTSVWGFTQTGQIATFASPTGTSGAITAGRCVRIRMGTNASGGVNQITNPSAAGSYSIQLGGTMTDSGTMAVAFVDDDSVSVSASVAASITFDIDTGVTTADCSVSTCADQPGYRVLFGVITPGTAKVSGASGVNGIWLDLDTNASGGAVITVKSNNGPDGLVSTSTPADKITSTTGVAGGAGVVRYGLCIAAVSASSGTLTNAAGYAAATATGVGTGSGTCITNGTVNTVVGLSTSSVSLLTTYNGVSNAPISVGRAQIIANASVTAVTPAHADYTDTLTFIATGTF